LPLWDHETRHWERWRLAGEFIATLVADETPALPDSIGSLQIRNEEGHQVAKSMEKGLPLPTYFDNVPQESDRKILSIRASVSTSGSW
jgi:hypothetical protein